VYHFRVKCDIYNSVQEQLRTLIIPMIKWKDNIKMGLQEVSGGCGDLMEWDQDRDRWRALVSMVMNCRVP
jgi:hypothetical protein